MHFFIALNFSSEELFYTSSSRSCLIILMAVRSRSLEFFVTLSFAWYVA